MGREHGGAFDFGFVRGNQLPCMIGDLSWLEHEGVCLSFFQRTGRGGGFWSWIMARCSVIFC